MNKIQKLEPRFVTAIPEKLNTGLIYASIEYATVAHLCCCGRGREVVTPLTPTDWKLTYDGQNISIHPSIGNWSFPGRSHYWIRNSMVQWAEDWTPEEIQAGRDHDCRMKARQFEEPAKTVEEKTATETWGIWAWFRRMLGK